ncbi:hypothetical protein Tco_1504090 [Tanacetum coccineum]
MTQIIGSGEWWKNDQYILATQVKQVFYLEDPAKPNVKVVEHVNHKKFFNRGVIVVENEPDIIHLDNSSDLPPSTSGNDLDNVTFYIDLHIDGESTEVDAPPDIIDVPGEDDDISDDEDPLPHDLADSDVEDLINDDDGVEKMADVARAHGGDGGGEDPSRPPPTSFGCAGCFINRGKGKRKPNLGGVKAGRKTRERTRNQVLKDAVAANKGRPIEIGFEDRADNTVVPTGPYSTQWGNYFGEMIRSIPLYHPSWQKVPAGDKARLMATLGSTYNLEPHMRSERWPRIEGYIQAQFGKSYNTNKATLKREHWIRDPETGAYDLDRIRRGKPDEYTDDEWEKYINFWNDPANAQRAETNRLNRSKSTVVSRHGSRSIPLTRHLMKMTSATQEEPTPIGIFAPGPDGKCLNGQHQEILEFKNLSFKVALFRSIKCSTLRHKGRVKKLPLETERHKSTALGCHRCRNEPDIIPLEQLIDLPPSIVGMTWIIHLSINLPYRSWNQRDADDRRAHGGEGKGKAKAQFGSGVKCLQEDPERTEPILNGCGGAANKAGPIEIGIGLRELEARVSTPLPKITRCSERKASRATFLGEGPVVPRSARVGDTHARDSEGGEDGDDTGREDSGDDTS